MPYRIACNFRGVKISFILKKEIFVSKNFVLPGSGARLGFSWVKNFVEVSSLTKFLPHENYTLYGKYNRQASLAVVGITIVSQVTYVHVPTTVTVHLLV